MIYKHLMATALILSSTASLAVDRNFDFFMTADPQYDNGAHDRNAVSTRTLQAIGTQITQNPIQNRGLMIAGDLTQNSRPNDEFEFYTDAIGFFKDWVYEGQGNHDEHDPVDFTQSSGCFFNATWCVDEEEIIEYIRRDGRSANTHFHSEGGVYSWDWQGVHFIQLGTYGGDQNYKDSWAADVDPYGSLEFMRDDLAQRVGPSGRPVVLMMHYTMNDAGDGGAWSKAQRADFWEALEGYNVVAIMSGHIHYGRGGGWSRTAYRPEGATKGPDSIPNIIVGAALNGIYFKAFVRNDQMELRRFFVETNGNSVDQGDSVVLSLAKKDVGFAELKNAASGLCLDFDGANPYNGAAAIVHGCAGVAWQRWKHDADTGLLHSKQNEQFCLDNKGQRYNGGGTHMWACWAGPNQQWTMAENALVTRANTNVALDAYGTHSGAQVGQWSFHGGNNQRWFWGRRDRDSAISTKVQGMQAGRQYDMKIRSKKYGCGLEWDGSLSGGERNAKFDCVTEGDIMTFIPSSNPSHQGNGVFAINGHIKTYNGTCGLEWDGSLSGGERNAKFDCSGSADPLTLITTGNGAAEVYIRSNNCGLEWDGSQSGDERNAKWDCEGGQDPLILSQVVAKQEYRQLQVLGKCIDVAPSNFHNGGNAYLWECHGGAWQRWQYEDATGYIRSQHNPGFCLDSTGGNQSGTNVAIHQCVDHINLKWDVVEGTIRPRLNHALALDIWMGQANNGQNLQLWTADGNAAQQFRWGAL